MRNIFAAGAIFIFLSASAFADEGFNSREITNNLGMPTGYTLNKREFTVGIGSIGFGITDNVQVETNIPLYLFQYANAKVKVSLIESPTMAIATGIGLGHFNLDVLDDGVSFTSLSPYLSYSQKVGTNTSLHLGGKFSYFTGESDIDSAKAESTSTGTSFYGGLEYSLSNKTKFLTEAGYDITFGGLKLGGGVLFGWEKFRLKLGVTYYNPEDVDGGFTLPVIGLWWRFKG